MQLTRRMTIAHTQLQEDLNRIQASLESHQRGMEEAKEAHAKATDALAEMRAAKIADDSVLVQVKEELAQKEELLSQAMTDLQATAQIEEKLRAREEEIEKVRAEHQQELATLREQASGTDEAVKAKHQDEIEVSYRNCHLPKLIPSDWKRRSIISKRRAWLIRVNLKSYRPC
jgi:chromosome segregation ATPase